MGEEEAGYARRDDDPRPEHADGGGHDRRPRQLRRLPRPGNAAILITSMQTLCLVVLDRRAPSSVIQYACVYASMFHFAETFFTENCSTQYLFYTASLVWAI